MLLGNRQCPFGSSKICKYEINGADDSKVNRADQLEYLTLNDKQKL